MPPEPVDKPKPKTAAMRIVREAHRMRRAAEGLLLSLPEAANRAGLPYSTMRNIVARGLIPAIRIPGGRGLWIKRRDLDKAIEAWKEQP